LTFPAGAFASVARPLAAVVSVLPAAFTFAPATGSPASATVNTIVFPARFPETWSFGHTC
jgi:hypothetical protein